MQSTFALIVFILSAMFLFVTPTVAIQHNIEAREKIKILPLSDAQEDKDPLFLTMKWSIVCTILLTNVLLIILIIKYGIIGKVRRARRRLMNKGKSYTTPSF